MNLLTMTIKSLFGKLLILPICVVCEILIFSYGICIFGVPKEKGDP